MKLVTYTHRNTVARLGVLIEQPTGQWILDLNKANSDMPASMLAFIQMGPSGTELARQAAQALPPSALVPAAEARLLAPLSNPGKILCLGHNYYDHLGQGRTSPADYPTIFGKTANTIIGPGEAVVIPSCTQQVDYEAELAVVIGKRARRVEEDQALDFVAGYTIFNDVSARDYQKRTSQWMIGKSFDTFGPMGPALVTADEIPDPGQLELWLTLNGLEFQRTNTRNMIFSIPYLIAYLSQVMTLEPGDLISTGTPGKTELAKSMPPFMKPGDEVKIGIEKVGELCNPVIAGA